MKMAGDGNGAMRCSSNQEFLTYFQKCNMLKLNGFVPRCKWAHPSDLKDGNAHTHARAGMAREKSSQNAISSSYAREGDRGALEIASDLKASIRACGDRSLDAALSFEDCLQQLAPQQVRVGA